MSALWPHPPYAEDQPHHHTILTTHVLHRGFQTGSILGSLSAGLYFSYLSLFRNSHTLPSPSAVTGTGIGASTTRALFARTLLRTTATGGVLGAAAMALLLPLRMRGREEIEWRDRSWRLLENRGQVEVDSFGVVGAMMGAGVVWWGVARKEGGPLAERREKVVGGWRGLRAGWGAFVRRRAGMVVGGAGVGAGMGVLAYLGWRYGINGGKWAEAVEDGVESGARGVGVV